MDKKTLISSLLLCVSLSPSLGASDLSELKARGKLLMLCFPHMESQFVRPDLDALRESGRPLLELRAASAYSGIDVEIMGAFADNIGVTLEIVPIVTSYADLFPALLAHQGDVVASSLTITEKRSESVDFSMPYFESWVVVGVVPGSKIHSTEDLAGLRAVVMRGSSQLEFLQRLEIPGLQLVLTDYALENTVVLEEGRADFALFDSRNAPGELVQQGLSDAVVAFRLRPFDYGYALRPHSDLRAELDRFLHDFRASGKLVEIIKRYSP